MRQREQIVLESRDPNDVQEGDSKDGDLCNVTCEHETMYLPSVYSTLLA